MLQNPVNGLVFGDLFFEPAPKRFCSVPVPQPFPSWSVRKEILYSQAGDRGRKRVTKK